MLVCPRNQFAPLMIEVRSKISLDELGIAVGTKTRTRGATGALIIEIPGADSGKKADALASRMREVLRGRDGVRVDRPTKTADVRIRGLEASIRPEKVAAAIAEKAGCTRAKIQLGEIRAQRFGQGSVWARLPMTAVKRACERGNIRVGWTRARIDPLETRPMRCFRCLERGHVRDPCPSTGQIGALLSVRRDRSRGQGVLRRSR